MAGPQENSEAARLWAANTRDTCEIAELLLSRGAYVDPICEEGTPLIIAARNGNPNTVVHLVYTPLSYAISASSVKCMELLIKAGADVNAGRPVTTPLLVAASYGFASCIKCLLEAGADTNIPDEFGRTAAEIASVQGWMDCVEILSPLTYPVAISAGTDDSLLNANDGCALKKQGDAAFEENDYADALALYTKAMEIDPDDSTLYAKRSLCWLHMSEEDKALDDAYTYRTMRMDLSNSCYEQTAALILVKEYARACRALVSALKLDLRSDDLD
ncbi:ankyrin repeat, PH and SEC7 domain containing protein secG-like isoform X2 [Lolium rigidum]|uniref:ankyrin repeat, PH and SEC7 domain containing protein secG-like isoform X2 n=1 Tax=Lolium rigidum TaxID=89674 RepID=UPI001F5DB66B|nr:ankyrin repeat, PH and SEC7 domain containing protein secG-like isoform X2 [Lolium rigidum]